MNLLGRDLILALGLNLVSTPDGLIVSRSTSTPTWPETHPPHLHVYQWSLSHEASTKLVAAAKDKMPGEARVMKAAGMHCTDAVAEERTEVFEREFFATTDDELSVSTLFWNNQRCVASVSLTLQQSAFFSTSDAGPHIALCQGPNDEQHFLEVV